jgi:ribulose 1,5-bisphosphate carboxylase large subunit-like protein
MLNLYYDHIPSGHYTATYYVESRTNLAEALEGIAIGQTIGNPTTRIPKWETAELVEKYCAKIIGKKEDLIKQTAGTVIVAYPAINIDWERDGFSHLLCVLLGGQVDIDIIAKCHVIDINDSGLIPKLAPKFGLSGIREYTGRYDRPLLGCIIKPKIGLAPNDYVTIVEEMIEGGADIIKEDEILGSPLFCSLEERLDLVKQVIGDRRVIYLTAINGDADSVLEKVKTVSSAGVNGIHINVWSGLGSYRAARKLDLPVALHFQKSGDKVFTHPDNPFRFDWSVICKIAAWSGVDTIHTGMWGSYLSDDPVVLKNNMDMLAAHNVVPALSCGMNAKLIPVITEKFGKDYLANVGSACHGHPAGVYAGVRQLREAIDATANN